MFHFSPASQEGPHGWVLMSPRLSGKISLPCRLLVKIVDLCQLSVNPS